MPSGSLQWVHPYGGIDKDTRATGYSKLLEQVIAADRWNRRRSGCRLSLQLVDKSLQFKKTLYFEILLPSVYFLLERTCTERLLTAAEMTLIILRSIQRLTLTCLGFNLSGTVLADCTR
jgi:hypothetical protein